MATTRLTQSERKAQTRAELLSAARAAFLRHGFHGASLDLIAEDAGYSKGAVYSNFASKDELFLAILDAYFEQRIRAYADVALDETSFEGANRAVARFMFEADRREPQWAPLLLEFWAHASRREKLRLAVVERRERFHAAAAALIDELASRHGAKLTLPAREVARGSGALMRGMGVEWLLEPQSADPELFEELHLAYMSGVSRREGG